MTRTWVRCKKCGKMTGNPEGICDPCKPTTCPMCGSEMDAIETTFVADEADVMIDDYMLECPKCEWAIYPDKPYQFKPGHAEKP